MASERFQAGCAYSRPPRHPLIINKRIKRGIQYLTCAALLLPSISLAGVLERLISSALLGHPSIQAQQAQERSAKAGVDSATWQYYPTPSVAIENATGNAYQGDSTVSTVRLQQPLWTGGRLTASVKKAEAGMSVSQSALEEVRQQLALRVVQSYGDWLLAHLKILAYEHSMATHVRLLDQVERRIEQGVSSDSDLILAVSRLQSVAADLSVGRAQKDIALARLGQLLGRRVDDAALSVALASPLPVIADPQNLLDLALAINPSLHKTQAQATVQETVIAERRADLSPEVYLRAERQYGNYSYPNAEPETRLFVGLSSRFGAGLSSLSNIEGARSQHQAALAEVDVQSRAVTEQILADHVLATSSDVRLEALRTSMEAAGRVSESYDRQFLAGRKTWLDVMNAARELTQARIQLADIQSAQIVATWRLAIYAHGLVAVVGNEQ